MVVNLNLAPYPDIEDLLLAYLAPVGAMFEAGVDTVKPPDGENGIEVLRVGGPDDGITDYPRVEITCYSDDRNVVKRLAETVRQAMQNDIIRASPVEYTDDEGVEWSVDIDRCEIDTPPETVGYRNPERRRKPAFYRLALRRPRTSPTS